VDGKYWDRHQLFPCRHLIVTLLDPIANSR
jgi:hypothetical protein